MFGSGVSPSLLYDVTEAAIGHNIASGNVLDKGNPIP